MGGKSKKVTVGFRYYMDILATLCHASPDDDVELVELQFGERSAWTGSVTESQTIPIAARDLFGGPDREGGVEGNVDVMMGEPTLSVNSFLGASMRASGIEGAVPAYRRVISLFFRGNTTNEEFTPSPEFELVPLSVPGFNSEGVPDLVEWLPSAFYWSALNPYFKKPRARIRRRFNGWYPEKSSIGFLANPAHIIYECITNSEWGMGYSSSDLDDDRMRAVADVLYDEGFGLGFTWSQASRIEDFIESVLGHITGVLSEDRVTGKLFLKLIRQDYDVGSLIELNPTNCVLESYDRPGIGENVNEVVLKYRTADGKWDSVTVQSLASIISQGQVISQSVEMPGIRDATLATRVGQRELDARVKPISKLRITTSRIAYSLYQGDVFKFTWPAHGIEAQYFRVVTMGVGSLDDGVIRIEAVEDVFGLPASSYAKPQPVGWVDTSRDPVPVVNQSVREASYYEVITETTEADRNTFPADFGYPTVLAARPQMDSNIYRLYGSPNTTDYVEVNTANWTPTATLTSDIGPLTTSFSVSGAQGVDQVAYGSLVYIGNELAKFLSYTAGTLVVDRGVADTVPPADGHPAGTRLWFLGDDFAGRDPDQKTEGEIAYYKAITVSSRGALEVASAPAMSLTFANRYERPYPPGNLKVNGVAYPTGVVDGITGVEFTWAHRDRVQQANVLVGTTEGSVGPEAGVTYRVRVYAADGVSLLHEYSGISGTSQIYSVGDAQVDGNPTPIIARIDSQRDGIDSWHYHELELHVEWPWVFPDGAVNESYSFSLTSGGSVPPITWSVTSGSLPSGLTLNSSTGEVEGVPTSAGAFSFTVQALDANSDANTQSIDMAIGTVSSLLHFDGADASTTFTDETGKTWTGVGAASISTVQSVFGGTSLQLLATGDYLATASHSDFAYGTDDFAVSFWVFPTVLSGFKSIFDHRTAPFQPRPTIYLAGAQLRYYTAGLDRIVGGDLAVNTWAFIELSRKDGITRLFINGVQSGPNFADSTDYTEGPLYLGASGHDLGGPDAFVGCIDEVLVVKVAGRHVTGFAPPSAPSDYPVVP